jgi:hypothetical protein
MEQPTLSSNQPHLPNVHEISNTLADQKRRPLLLRRASRSDPNFQPEEPKFDALQHVLHGIAEVNSGISINKLGFDNDKNYLSLMPLDQSKSSSAVPSAFDSHKVDQTLERKLSAFNLAIRSDDPNSSLGSIRKAASFIHGTNFGIGLNTPTSYFTHPQHHRAPNFSIGGGGSSNFHSSSVSPAVEDPSHHSGGLQMQVGSKSNSLAPNKVNEVQHSSSMAGGLFSNAGTDTSANNTHVGGMIANASTDSLPRQKTGVMGVFGRGFFAKPVIRSEEENYRYIMALDR